MMDMTKELAVRILTGGVLGTSEQTHEAVTMAVRALSQPEHEIQNILEYLDTVLHPIISPDHWSVYSELHDMISVLPSAQKTGRWITDAAEYYGMLNERGLAVDEYTPYFTDDIACSQCLAKYNIFDNETQFFKHCPNCGAKMEDKP